MKLLELKHDYYHFSSLTSTVVRQLNFAGFGIIWIFNSRSLEKIHLPNELFYPSLFIIISLGFDLLQYVYATIMTGYQHRKFEKENKKDEDDVKYNKMWNWPTNFFFSMKILSTLIAYILLLLYILVTLFVD